MKTLVVFLALLVADVAFTKHVFQFEQLKDGGKHWAFLVAGSNGYDYYRQQADVCHAYQIMKSHGIPDEQIIVMMYDDIAYNSENPFLGNIINRPNGPNVYPGVPKDYVKDDVNPNTFISVLKGEKDKVNGKVIDSGPNDHIFVDYSGLGAQGIIAFIDDMLEASTLNTAIQDMYDNKRFAKMVFYVEASYAGSMFENLLPKDINVFATTAANSNEGSYACYFDQTRHTYLGDYYSVNWMEDSDKEDLNTETLQEQYTITKKLTNTSHVMKYGEMDIGKMTVAQFQGSQKSKSVPSIPSEPGKDAVPSEDVPLESVRRSMPYAKDEDELLTLKLQEQNILDMRQHVDKTIKKIVSMATADHQMATNILANKQHVITKWSCYEAIVDHVAATCQQLNIPKNHYALGKLYTFVNMCEEEVRYEEMELAVSRVCGVYGEEDY